MTRHIDMCSTAETEPPVINRRPRGIRNRSGPTSSSRTQGATRASTLFTALGPCVIILALVGPAVVATAETPAAIGQPETFEDHRLSTTSSHRHLQTGIELQTDGVPVSATVPAGPDGALFQFHADAGTTYLLDTETGTLTDTVMTLLDVDRSTVIVENDDDARATGGLDSYIEWTCAASGEYYVRVTGFGGSSGTITLSVAAAVMASGDDPCGGGGATLQEVPLSSCSPLPEARPMTNSARGSSAATRIE